MMTILDDGIKKPKDVWVLTFKANDYDQHGDYFVAIFAEEPTLEVVMHHLVELGAASEREALESWSLEEMKTENGCWPHGVGGGCRGYYLNKMTPVRGVE